MAQEVLVQTIIVFDVVFSQVASPQLNAGLLVGAQRIEILKMLFSPDQRSG